MIIFLLDLSPASCWHRRCLCSVSEDGAVQTLVQPCGRRVWEQIQLRSNVCFWAGFSVGQFPYASRCTVMDMPCKKPCKVKVEWGIREGCQLPPLTNNRKVLVSRMTIVAFETGPVEDGRIFFSPEFLLLIEVNWEDSVLTTYLPSQSLQ